MRVVVPLLVASLVLAMLPTRVGASTSDLVRQLDGLVASFPGGSGIWISDPSVNVPVFTHDAEEHVIAASLYKLGILAEAERRVEAGELRYLDPITIEPEDVTTDGSYEDVGATLTLDEALEAMITISDNGSALALWHVLGGANIDATLAKAGMPDFHVAYDDTEDNWATPHAIATFFTLLANRRLVSPSASDRMLRRLERQQISDRLPAQLPADVVIAHKTGNLPGLAHDAGIIYTKSGPRVVVAMTWDAPEDEAASFISSLGALVYSAVLEPQANARFQVSKTAIAADTASQQHVIVPITNIGTRSWTTSGPGAVALTWELRNAQAQLVTSAPRPEALPALAPDQTRNVGFDVAVPAQPGTYTVTIGLMDESGRALAAQGAATASFSIRAHRPYLVSAQIHVPIVLHHAEPSAVLVRYTALTPTGEHPLAISWRAIDTRTNRTAQQGSSAVGVVRPGAEGTFFVSFAAPTLTGTYRLAFELTEGNVAVSETQTTTVDIAGPRTYGGEDGRPLPSSAELSATPAPTRAAFPTVTIPKPALPIELPFPRGKAPTP